MATQRAHIVLPVELVKAIDELVGPRGRSAFLVETAEKEIRRRKLMEFLEGDEPAWHDKDHPDLAKQGTAEWVRRLRREASVRHKGRDEHFHPI